MNNVTHIHYAIIYKILFGILGRLYHKGQVWYGILKVHFCIGQKAPFIIYEWQVLVTLDFFT